MSSDFLKNQSSFQTEPTKIISHTTSKRPNINLIFHFFVSFCKILNVNKNL